jgi:hypothetical protein
VRRLYVYYRVARADARAVVDAVHALQGQWQSAQPALQCTVLRRDDDGSGDDVTLMETYCTAAGVSPDWQARIEREARAALAPWRCTPRHVEVFLPCDAS